MNQLSARVEEVIVILFKDEISKGEIRQIIMRQCSDDLPLVRSDQFLIERIQLGVLKVSGGDISKLRIWVREAQQDWRDVLEPAGFYSDPNAHLEWVKQIGV